MFRNRLPLRAILPLAVLLGSIGVDIHAILSVRPALTTALSSGPAVPLPGPRRYPPGYRAGTLAWLDTTGVRHKTVIKN